MDLLRTDSVNPDFIELVSHLDKELQDTDGEEHDFYKGYNKIDTLKYVLLLFSEGEAIGCGAIKEFDQNSMEVKRMFVLKKYRGRGCSSKILAGLEDWCKELGFSRTVLETGKRQISAIALYRSKNYTIIQNYGQYTGIENSLCFEKRLTS